MRAATTRIQHLSVARAKNRNCSSSMDCNNEASQASTSSSLSKEQETSPNCFELYATVSASIHRQGFSRSSSASDNLNVFSKTMSRFTPSADTSKDHTIEDGLSEMHPSLNASFNSLDRLRAFTPDALLTETLAPKPETASLDHFVDPVHVTRSTRHDSSGPDEATVRVSSH